MRLCFQTTLLLILCKICTSCYEEENKRPIPLRKSYRNGQPVWETEEIVNSTIVCSNIYTLGQLSHPYREETYKQYLVITNSTIPVINALELHNFSTIVKLSLSHAGIETIFPGAFTGLVNLRNLYLDDNKLTEISKGIFNILYNLEILDLSNNNIHTIENMALEGLTSLTQLYFRNNKLSTLNEAFFKPFDNLTYVDFSQNPLKIFTVIGELKFKPNRVLTGGLVEISNFTFINMSFTQIKHLDFDLFPNMNQIDLSNSEIVLIENYQNVNIISLDLSNNKLEKIDTPFGKIRIINLSHNKIGFLPTSPFNQPTSVVTLNVGYNQLSSFSNTIFHNCTAMQVLVLRKNKIENIDLMLFHDLTNLIELDLSGNLIENFQFGVFDSLVDLKVLNISENRLTTLSPNRFHSVLNLDKLYFDHNQISSLEVRDFEKYFSNVKILCLDYNPWTCQELLQLDMVAKKHGIKIIWGITHGVENYHGIACINEVEVDNSDLSQNTQKAIESESINGLKAETFNFKNFKHFKFVNKLQTNNYDRSDNNISIFNSVMLAVVALLLSILVILVYSSIKKSKTNVPTRRVSEMELMC